MPQEVISLKTFQGQVNNPHQEDIPDNMGVTVSDVDPHLESGVITGIKSEGADYQYGGTPTQITDVTYSDWIKYDSSGTEKWDLIYLDLDDNDVSVISDFYAAEASRGQSDLITAGAPKCIKTFGRAAQIGRGKQSGSAYEPYAIYRLQTAKQIFNGTHDLGATEPFSAGLKAEFGYCNNSTGTGGFIINSFTENAGAGGYFQSGILYNYGVSVVYDGLQETNMQVHASGVTPAAVDTSIEVEIRAVNGYSNPEDFDSRITAVKLYRAESSDGTLANLGLYRLVSTISINSTGWLRDGVTNHIHYNVGGNYYDDNGTYEGGATYEEETGIPETLATDSAEQYVYYQLNEVGGGYHWMADAYVPSSGGVDAEWDRYIFRSKKFRPNMVDWTNDFIILPEIPVDLKYYNDKLYAFSENKVYRIHPELLIIEDTYEGAGVSEKDGLVGTEFGMFFCNVNGAYMIKNNQVITISDPISNEPTSVTGAFANSWEELATSSYSAGFQRIIARYIPDKRIVLFTGGTLGNATTAFGFYLPTQQWYHFTLGSQAIASDSGMFAGKDGEVYLSNASKTFKLFASTGDPATREIANYVTKEFHLGEPSQNKSWNMIKWDGAAGSGTIQVKYATNGTNVGTSGTTATSDAWINTYAKTFQVWIRTTVDATVDSLDILVRRLYGKR